MKLHLKIISVPIYLETTLCRELQSINMKEMTSSMPQTNSVFSHKLLSTPMGVDYVVIGFNMEYNHKLPTMQLDPSV